VNPQSRQANFSELRHHTLSPQMVRAYFCGLGAGTLLLFTTSVPDNLRNFLLMTLALRLQEQSFMPSSQLMEMYFSSEALWGLKANVERGSKSPCPSKQ
jgi:hypothetical protein